MDFEPSERQTHWRDRVRDLLEANIRPNMGTYRKQDAEGERWKVIQVIEDEKAKARNRGIWNLFMPPTRATDRCGRDVRIRRTRPTNLEYALCAERDGRIGWASEVFNLLAPTPAIWRCFTAMAIRAKG